MTMTTDSQFVQDKFDETFHLDHDKRDSFREKYKGHLSNFHVHLPQQDWQGEGPVRVLEAPQQSKLVSITLSVRLDGSPETVDAHLAALRKSLDALIREGEQCHLFVEEEPRVHDDGTLRCEVKGTIEPMLPGDLPPTSP